MWGMPVGTMPPGRDRPKYLIVMGVSSCGKSTVAALLARRFGWDFIDGDDLHPAANVAKMRAGTPLDDHDRQPWLEKIAATLEAWRAVGKSGVIACSALHKDYRNTIRAGKEDVVFVYLRGDQALFAQRIAARQGHFMPPTLLASQFATLEEPEASEHAITVDAALPPEVLVERVVRALG
jgi:gluconokinase